MSLAIFPGSFNPFHEGHAEIVSKANRVFSEIIVAVGINPEKGMSPAHLEAVKSQIHDFGLGNIRVDSFSGLLADYVSKMSPDALIRGIRNFQDFEFEKTQQYLNEDLGISVPTFYVISSRELTHISSSAKRAINKFRK